MTPSKSAKYHNNSLSYYNCTIAIMMYTKLLGHALLKNG